MARTETSFKNIIAELEAYYGCPHPPPISDPLLLILYENVGYLVDDERRDAAFRALRRQVGLKPIEILAAPIEQLIGITKLGGIHAELRAQRLKEIAHIVLNDFAGDLSSALTLPLPKAVKALKRFPSIGDPGAEKILLFCKIYPFLALESNGLRVLLRLGFGKEHKSYSMTYRSVRESLAGQTGEDYDFLIKAHQLLRRHGKDLCRTSKPVCSECPVNSNCCYFKTQQHRASVLKPKE